MALIVANWKMNGRREDIRSALHEWQQSDAVLRHEIIWALPAAYFAVADCTLATHPSITLSSQDVSMFSQDGAFTGEISASMMKDLGCHYAMVGHSERRKYFGEDNLVLSRKLQCAYESDLTPIYCVGESREEKTSGITLSVLWEQLNILKEFDEYVQRSGLVLAYEPVWAIGSGQIPPYEEIEQAIGMLRESLLQILGSFGKVRFVYGGSVDATVAPGIAALCDGVLVGSRSLQVSSFVDVCESV